MRAIWDTTGNIAFDLFRLGCHGLILMIFLSFLGGFFPLGDSLAVFRVELTVMLALCGVFAFVMRRSLIPPAAAITVILSAASVLPYADGEKAVASPDLTLHQHNLLYGNQALPIFLDYVRAYRPDILTLQEFDGRNRHFVDEIAKEYPHYHVCLYDTGGVGVFSREGTPIASGCAQQSKLAWMRIDTVDGPVTIVSVHLFWPFPKAQFWQVDDYVSEISALPKPVIVGGDFNMVPWANSVRQIRMAADGQISQGLQPTYHWRGGQPTFRIDHVIAPQDADMAVTRLPKLGSDHNGLWADISLKPQPGLEPTKGAAELITAQN